MKDHEKRELVNNLRDIAVKYAGSQQLREKIARCVLPALDGNLGGELLQIKDDSAKEFDQALAQQISDPHPFRSRREVDLERHLHRLEVELPGELVVVSRPIGRSQESDEQLARQQDYARGWNECRTEVLKLLPVDCALQNQENLTAEHGGESPMEAP